MIYFLADDSKAHAVGPLISIKEVVGRKMIVASHHFGDRNKTVWIDGISEPPDGEIGPYDEPNEPYNTDEALRLKFQSDNNLDLAVYTQWEDEELNADIGFLLHHRSIIAGDYAIDRPFDWKPYQICIHNDYINLLYCCEGCYRFEIVRLQRSSLVGNILKIDLPVLYDQMGYLDILSSHGRDYLYEGRYFKLHVAATSSEGNDLMISGEYCGLLWPILGIKAEPDGTTIERYYPLDGLMTEDALETLLKAPDGVQYW